MSTPLHVLIVEDSLDDARLTVDLLTGGGFEVVWDCVETAEAMHEALAREPWDVVLCDYSMPHLDSPRALAVLRASGLDVPFIIVSGTVGEEAAVEGMRSGAQDYVMKNNLARLPAAVTRELRNAEQRRQRKTVEEALRRSEERFRALVETSTDWIWEIDENGIYRYVSPHVQDLLGFLPEEVLGRTPLDFMPPDEAHRVSTLLALIMARREPFHLMENVNRHKDGRLVTLETSGVPIFDPTGKLRGYRGIDRDISERKQSEAALRRERDMFESLASTVPDLIYFKDRQSRFVRINTAMVHFFGLRSASDALGLTDFDFFASQHAQQASADEQRVMTTGEPLVGVEEKETWPDGRITWASTTKVPWRDATGNIIGLIGISRDITARKEGERRLREQAAALNNANEAIIVGDLQERITFWNRGAERVLGWTAEEMIGRPLTEVLALGGVSTGTDIYASLGKFEDWRGELNGHNRAGDPLTLEVSVTTLRDEGGAPTGWLGICADITEKKKLQDRFLRAQRLESLGMLAAGIAHDLNNILAPIGMAASLLRTRTVVPADLRLLETLDHCAERGTGLVRQVLEFVHGVSGEPRMVQVKHLLRDIAAVVTETFPKSITLEYHVPKELWPIVAKPTQIHQVLLNLCVNARDAMPKGGVLRLHAENTVLDAAAAQTIENARPGSWLVLEVGDTGTGIPPNILPQIWEPFFTTKSVDKGTGLGLSTVRGIVATHNGFITLETEPGRGTTFRVYLPAEISDGGEAGSPASAPPGQGKNELILLVDDEETIRETAQIILNGAGYRVVTARDGGEGAELFQAQAAEFAMVVTDLDMPRADGETLARSVHALRPDLPVLAISGITSGSMSAKATAFAEAFLQKPFAAPTLLSAVQSILHKTSEKS